MPQPQPAAAPEKLPLPDEWTTYAPDERGNINLDYLRSLPVNPALEEQLRRNLPQMQAIQDRFNAPGGAGAATEPPKQLPGTSPQGNAALADIQAFQRMMQDAVKKYTPPPSPMEEWRRNGPAPIAVIHGSDVPGQLMAGPSARRSQSSSYSGSYPAAGGGGGGMGAGHQTWQSQQGSEVVEQAGPYRYGRFYETPMGPMGVLPNADVLQYEREQQGREQALAALMEAGKAYAPAYQTQGTMTDAQMRMMAEFGPWKQAREVGSMVTAKGMGPGGHGDVDRAIREGKEAEQALIERSGGGFPAFMPGGQQTTTPEQELVKRMKKKEQEKPPAPYTDEAILKFLTENNVVNKDRLDAEALARGLYGNQEFARKATPQLAEKLLKVGVPSQEVSRALAEARAERAANVHDYNQRAYADKIELPADAEQRLMFGAGQVPVGLSGTRGPSFLGLTNPVREAKVVLPGGQIVVKKPVSGVGGVLGTWRRPTAVENKGQADALADLLREVYRRQGATAPAGGTPPMPPPR